jgi:hypothetical protein
MCSVQAKPNNGVKCTDPTLQASDGEKYLKQRESIELETVGGDTRNYQYHDLIRSLCHVALSEWKPTFWSAAHFQALVSRASNAVVDDQRCDNASTR